MGAWGIGVFENDSALDWIYELNSIKDVSGLQQYFDLVISQQYAEIDESCFALAAAEVVAALVGAEATDLPGEVKQWVSDHPLKVSLDQRKTAVQAVDLVLSSSEAQELWSGADEYNEWRSLLNHLISRLKP